MRFFIIIVTLAYVGVPANAEDDAAVDQQFRDVQPLLRTFCIECHSSKRKEGELDLERFTSVSLVRADTKPWQTMIVQLETAEMPPKDQIQPTTLQRQQLIDWSRRLLRSEARRRAGDPGHVPLHRLSNAEYNNTVRDLTGVDLQPAREFPTDGAAGEGFTNAAEALSMSPALMNKYVNAAKQISNHAVLLPDGFRFSHSTTRRDRTDESLAALRGFYRQFSSEGSLPLKPYVAALIDQRSNLLSGDVTLDAIASERTLSPTYLQTLWDAMNRKNAGFPLNRVQAQWKNATPGDVDRVVGEVSAWFDRIWAYPKVGSYRSDVRQTPKDPTFAATHAMTVRVNPIPGQDQVTLHLIARNTVRSPLPVIWKNPRFEGDGLSSLALRDYENFGSRYELDLSKVFGATERYLAAAVERANNKIQTPQQLASRHTLNEGWLKRWIKVLQVRPRKVAQGSANSGREVAPVTWTLLDSVAPNTQYPAIQGWRPTGQDLPSVITNSSDRIENVPGQMMPHSVGVHPMPNEFVAVVWTSPIGGRVRVNGKVNHAHPQCGNGVAWWVEQRSPARCAVVSEGAVELGNEASFETPSLKVSVGDTLTLAIDAKAASHVCDLTRISFTITASLDEEPASVWDLAADVADSVTDGNPHDDKYGNKDVWTFVQGSSRERPANSNGPTGSQNILAKWKQAASTVGRETEAAKLAKQLLALLTSDRPGDNDPNRGVFDSLVSVDGPLLRDFDVIQLSNASKKETEFGIPAQLFGKHPLEQAVGRNDLVRLADEVTTLTLPASLFRNHHFVVEGHLSDQSPDSAAQFQVLTSPPTEATAWDAVIPVVAEPNGPAAKQLLKDLANFRALFPPNICYPHIIPLDEVVCLKTFHRDDEPLRRLFLNERQSEELERLWDEHRFITKFPVTENEYLPLFIGFVTQDQPQSLVEFFEGKRSMFQHRADKFESDFESAAPRQLQQLADFASHAWRRPLVESERQALIDLYETLRGKKVTHEEAIRSVLARVLMSPSFLLHLQNAPTGTASQPLTDWELASRLSYFLWSSQPDQELRDVASAGRLHQPDVLAQQTKRMLKDGRVRSLAIEFGTQWIHVRNFDRFDSKSKTLFPEFDESMRRTMSEEAILFFQDLFQNNGSPIRLLDADYTFLNESLARHYGIEGVDGTEWRRIDGVRKYGRGGVLGFASVQTTQAGASRTSPVLRGNWVVETLLGEQIPNPPPNVPQFPDSELANTELSMREIVAKHVSDVQCASCHQKIDPFGLALERFDPIGRRRDQDSGGRPVNASARLKDGTEFSGIDGLRNYLLTYKQKTIIRLFYRRLLGYALGRSVSISDERLLDQMMAATHDGDDGLVNAVGMIVQSPQFLMIRGAQPEQEK